MDMVGVGKEFGPSSKRKRARRVARMMCACIIAKFAPTQTRGPAPKGKIKIAIARSDGFRRKPVRVKFVRALPPHLMPVESVDRQKQHVVSKDLPAAEGVGFSDIARQHADWRVKTHCLLDHLLHVGHRFQVIGACRRISQDRTGFRLSPLLPLWMQRQKEQ